MSPSILGAFKLLACSVLFFIDVSRSVDVGDLHSLRTSRAASGVEASSDLLLSPTVDEKTTSSKIPDISAAPPVKEQNKMMFKQAANSAIIKEGKVANENARVVREASNAKIVQHARLASKAEENVMVQNFAIEQRKNQNTMIQNAAAIDTRQQNTRVIKESGNAEVIEAAKVADKADENIKIQRAASNANLIDASKMADKAAENIKIRKAANNQKIINEATTQAVLDNRPGATDRLNNKELIAISRSSDREQLPAFVEMVESSEKSVPRSVKSEIDAHKPHGNTAFGPLHMSKSQQNPAYIELISENTMPPIRTQQEPSSLPQGVAPAQGPAREELKNEKVEFVEVVSKDLPQQKPNTVVPSMAKSPSLGTSTSSNAVHPAFVDVVPVKTGSSGTVEKGNTVTTALSSTTGDSQKLGTKSSTSNQDEIKFIDVVENNEAEKHETTSKGRGFRRILKSGLTSGDKAALTLVNEKRASKPGDAVVETVGDGKKSANDVAIESTATKDSQGSAGGETEVELGGDSMDEEIESAVHKENGVKTTATTATVAATTTSATTTTATTAVPAVPAAPSTNGATIGDDAVINKATPATKPVAGAILAPTASPTQNITIPTLAPTPVTTAATATREQAAKDDKGYEVLPVESKIDVEEAVKEENKDIQIAEKEEGGNSKVETSNRKVKKKEKGKKKKSDDDDDDDKDDDTDDETDDDDDETDDGDDEKDDGDEDTDEADDYSESDAKRQGGRGGGRGRGGKKGRGGRGGRGGNKGGRKGGMVGKKKKHAQSDDGAPSTVSTPPTEIGGVSQVAPDHPMAPPPIQTRPKPKSAADAWAMYKAAHPDKPKEEEDAKNVGENMMKGMESAIDINEDSGGGSESSVSVSSSSGSVSTSGRDNKISGENDVMAKIVQHILNTHQKAKDSWEGLETGLDFGLVLAFILFVIFFIFWITITKCCCRPAPGVAYTQIAKVDADDDIDNDLEVGTIHPDKSPRVLELQKASPPLNEETGLESSGKSRLSREPRYTDDGSGEVAYTDHIDYGDEGDEEASDESYVDEKEDAYDKEKHGSAHPSIKTLEDNRGYVDRPVKSTRGRPEHKDDNDNHCSNESTRQKGVKLMSERRYPKPSQHVSSSLSSSSSSPSPSPEGAAALTAEETEKIAASLGITEYSGHYSTDGTPMRRIDEETRRSTPPDTLKPTACVEDSWGDDDLDLSDEED